MQKHQTDVIARRDRTIAPREHANTPGEGFDPQLWQKLMESFDKLEQEGLLPERNRRAVYGSTATQGVHAGRPRLTLQQINEQFARKL